MGVAIQAILYMHRDSSLNRSCNVKTITCPALLHFYLSCDYVSFSCCNGLSIIKLSVAVFAKRRIRLDPSYIAQFILNTDLDGLLSEHCELLLQIVPQEKEVHTLTITLI